MLLLFIGVFVLNSLTINVLGQEQNSSTQSYHQEFISLGESDNRIDFSAKIIDCNGTNQVLLTAFNENPNQQIATFTILVTNIDGQSFSKNFNVTIEKGSIYSAKCGVNEHDDLKIDLPSNYDAKKVVLTISYI